MDRDHILLVKFKLLEVLCVRKRHWLRPLEVSSRRSRTAQDHICINRFFLEKFMDAHASTALALGGAHERHQTLHLFVIGYTGRQR